jgi:subtilisin family serine protease
MKKCLLCLAVFAGLVFSGCQKEEAVIFTVDQEPIVELNHGDIVPNSYIVVYKEMPEFKSVEGTYEQKVQFFHEQSVNILKESNVSEEAIDYVYTGAIYGVALTLNAVELESLRNDKRVDFIEPNRYVKLNYEIVNDPEEVVGAKAQTTPWGITRVGGAVNYTGARRAWVLDTGIQSNHPDLRVDTGRSRSFVSGQTYQDGNGHGTHVAGTIAAVHNTIGVIGVAAGAWVVAVKVLANDGGGTYAGIIAGVDYVRTSAAVGDVANLSLGGPVSTALDNAVISCSNRGIWMVIAAGNDYRNANNYSPARVNGTYIYTVSAFDSNNRFANFSNYANPPIDWSAPGVSIYSTWIGSSYRTINGTSMAAPHVAGIRLFTNPKVYGYVTNDPDGNADSRVGR